ncbi:hypothetical protein SOM12_14935 [Flavobacterium sp. CFBP9031]|uniref:hypothetical protein n=1 Tax=Flavobacterium sp. CFBP9031 TaxID=3096538 RepID=UPI002A69D944|nr:hypothetical protein [Flavobacterium sp. CFBP9031]MDY0988724.1 hypothetical protein [Flavobacterium sp. CFBP9031]
MKKENRSNGISISCGKTTDDYSKLQKMCEEKAMELAKTIEIGKDEIVSVPCWTSDFPELIGVAHFEKDENGTILTRVDFSEGTL